MPSLLERQERLAAALESADAATEAGVEVYRRAIAANYRRALAATYPVVRELLGRAAFEEAVDAFVRAHPPVSGDLNVYGAEFGALLAPVLADMARLEWAVDEAARSADVDATPAEVIAALTVLPEEAIEHVRLRLHPSCRLVANRIAVYETWRARQGGASAPVSIMTEEPSSDLLLVRRHEGRALVERIAPGEFAWLRALHSGETFADALTQALERDAAFDLESTLSARVHDGTVCGVEPGRYNPRHG